MEEDMEDEKFRTSAVRQKRVKRLKKYIILTLTLSILLPYILCAVLATKLHGVAGNVQELQLRVQELERRLQEKDRVQEKFSGRLDGMDRQLKEAEERIHLLEEKDLSGISVSDVEMDEAEEAEEAAAEDTAITAAHSVYLTFDDGPSAYTEEILDILDEYDVKATFFVVGKETDAAKTAMQEIVARGHTLGMHSYSHKYKELYASVDSFAEDFKRIQEYLYEVTGQQSALYRFPGGSSNKVSSLDMREFADYLDGQGVRFFDWNISSGDGGQELLTTDALVENVTSNISRFKTAVVLMHDSADKPTTVEALPEIIEKIQAMEDTVILPITEDTTPVQHIKY